MPLSRRGFVRLSVPVPGTFRIQKRSGTPVKLENSAARLTASWPAHRWQRPRRLRSRHGRGGGSAASYSGSGALYLISSQPTRYAAKIPKIPAKIPKIQRRYEYTGNNELIRRLLIYDKMQKIREDIRSFIITKSNRRATLFACATLVWPPPSVGVILQTSAEHSSDFRGIHV